MKSCLQLGSFKIAELRQYSVFLFGGGGGTNNLRHQVKNLKPSLKRKKKSDMYKLLSIKLISKVYSTDDRISVHAIEEFFSGELTARISLTVEVQSVGDVEYAKCISTKS